MKATLRFASLASLSFVFLTINAHPLEELLNARTLRNRAEEDSIFSWVRNYAALGDSYAAGIGIGQLRKEKDAYDCSRYDGGYPEKVQEAVQSNVYEYIACSGDTTKEVLEKQLGKLSQPQYDLITMSAGGNDVGFSDVLKACIFLNNGKGPCDSALEKAEDAIGKDLAGSVTKVLDKTRERVSKDNGVIVWTLYAKFFDEAPKPCEKKSWCFTDLAFCNQLLTVDLRQKMNALVGKANDRISDTINKWNEGKGRAIAHYAHWSPYVAALSGQLCAPGMADDPNNHANDNEAFLRPSGLRFAVDTDDLKRRGEDNTTEILLAERGLSRRLPDSILQNFHPNDLGASYQAQTVLASVFTAYEVMQKVGAEDSCSASDAPPNNTPPSEPQKEDLRCADVNLSPKSYIRRESMEEHATRFCDEQKITKAGTYEAYYDGESYNGAIIRVETDQTISAADCKYRLFQITNGCVPAKNNPMNWKYGGELTVGKSLYKINIIGLANGRWTGPDNSPLQKPLYTCRYMKAPNEKVFQIEGAGFANAPQAKELRDQLEKCYGKPAQISVFQQGRISEKGMEWFVSGLGPYDKKECVTQVLSDLVGYEAKCE